MICPIIGARTGLMMIHHRNEAQVRQPFEMGFGKFPAEELYDLREDPDYMTNVVDEPEYTDVRARLSTQLVQVLQEQDDPCVVEPECRLERPPLTDR